MTEVLSRIASEALGTNPPWFVTALVAALVVAVVAYFSSYLGQKAKLRAVEENLEKLVAQTERTTQATEDIKTSIAGNLWLDQARWTLKRDAYAGMLKALGDFLWCQCPTTDAERERVLLDSVGTLRRELVSHFSLGRIFTSSSTHEIVGLLIESLESIGPDRDRSEGAHESIRGRAWTAYMAIADIASRDLMGFVPPPQGL